VTLAKAGQTHLVLHPRSTSEHFPHALSVKRSVLILAAIDDNARFRVVNQSGCHVRAAFHRDEQAEPVEQIGSYIADRVIVETALCHYSPLVYVIHLSAIATNAAARKQQPR